MGKDEMKAELFSTYLTSLNQDLSSHDADVLLLTCIDFRFFPKVLEHMRNAGLIGKYDQVIVAGAELGPVVDFPPDPRLHWQQFFLEHLALSIDLHKIQRLLVLGHRGCGAYRKFDLLPEHPTPGEEYRAHKEQADKLKVLIQKFYPKLPVDNFLLSLDKPDEPITFHRL